MKRVLPIAVLVAFSVPAFAAQTTGTLNVEATVLNTCAVATSPVVFLNVGLASVQANGSVTVTCTNSGSFTVELDGGGSADIANRTLSHTTLSGSFNYQLYLDSGRTTVWGDGVTGSTQSGTGPSDTLIVYGETTSTPILAGSYADTVQVTVTY